MMSSNVQCTCTSSGWASNVERFLFIYYYYLTILPSTFNRNNNFWFLFVMELSFSLYLEFIYRSIHPCSGKTDLRIMFVCLCLKIKEETTTS